METYSEYLAHHGILGQKWGKKNGPPYPLSDDDRSAKEKRLNPSSKSRGEIEEARSKYKRAKKEYSKAHKAYYKKTLAPNNMSRLKESEQKKKELEKKETDVRDARINYDFVRKGGDEKALRNAYLKELRKHGLPESYADVQSGGKSTKLISDITKKHGEEYADKLLKRRSKELYTELAASGVLYLGSLAVLAYAGYLNH